MAAVLITGGAMRLLWSLATATPRRGASAAHGAATLLLGSLLWAVWPGTSLWAVGVFVGADLLASGATLVYLAGAGRRMTPRGA